MKKYVMHSYPGNINIELTNRCNLRCSFCVNSKMNRPNADISFEILSNLIDQLREYPYIEMITPVGLGEPFLHPEWNKILTTIKQEFPKIPLHLVTNGVRLTTTVSEELCKLFTKGDSILISINASNKNTYTRLMGLDRYNVVRNNILTLISKRDEKKGQFSVSVQFMRERGIKNWFEFIQFIIQWKVRLRNNGDIINIRELENWGGQIYTTDTTTLETNNRYACPALWQIVMINCEGDIYPCCEQLSHIKGSLKLGNIQDITLNEVFNSEKYHKIRDDHLKGKWNRYPECVNCDFWASSRIKESEYKNQY